MMEEPVQNASSIEMNPNSVVASNTKSSDRRDRCSAQAVMQNANSIR